MNIFWWCMFGFYSGYLLHSVLSIPSHRQLYIINGTLAQQGKWKHMAAIINSDGIGNDVNVLIRCGGSVYDDWTIITAGHCLLIYRENETINDLRVYLGHHNISNVDERLLFNISSFRVHDQINLTTMHNDIGLIRLDRPINLTGNSIEPVVIANHSTRLVENQQCFVLGWGITEVSFESSHLREISVPLVDDKFCAKKMKDFDSKIQLCAGYSEGFRDACLGDSGGPLMCPDSQNNDELEKSYRLCGLVSFGEGCAQPNSPGYYTKVSSYLEWITTTVEQMSQNSSIIETVPEMIESSNLEIKNKTETLF